LEEEEADREKLSLLSLYICAPVKLPLRKHFSHSTGQLLLEAVSLDGQVADQNCSFNHELQGRPQKELKQIGELLMHIYF